MKFNSKIFMAALIPFYGYVLMSAYALLRSHFTWRSDEVISTLVICIVLFVAGACAARKEKRYHLLSLLIFLTVGVLGIRAGLLVEPMNWPELVASAFVIAFALAFYEMIEYHRSIWHETD